MRDGQAFAATIAPTTSGQTSSTSGIPPGGPNRASSRRTSPPSRSTTAPPPVRRGAAVAGSPGSASAVVAVISVWPRPSHVLRQHAAAVDIELRENVVEQEQRRLVAALVEQCRLGEQEREDRGALLALASRTARRSRPPADDRDVVEVRARGPSSPARDRGRAVLRALRASAGRPRTTSRAESSPSSPAAAAKGASSSASVSARTSTSAAPGRRPAPSRGRSRPGRPLESRVSLRERGRVVRRHRRAGREEAAQGPVEVRPAGGRAALDDREPVGREDERRGLAAELLGRAEPRTVHLRPLALDRRTAQTPIRSGAAPRVPSSRIRAALLAEADQLGVGARPRREALRADVQRLEQVRLAGAVRADRQHEARLERELQARVRADVRQEDRADDQPASLIGMIRYQKSSPGPWISPGRSGSIRRRRISSLVGGLDPVAQEVGVEADLERFAVEPDRQRLAGLARRPPSASRSSPRPRRSAAGAASCGAPSPTCGGRPRGAPRAAASPRA